MRKKHNKDNRIKHKEEGARDTARTKNGEYGFGKAECNKTKQQSRKESYSGLLLTKKITSVCLIPLILREIRVWTFFVDKQDYIKEMADSSIVFSSR